LAAGLFCYIISRNNRHFKYQRYNCFLVINKSFEMKEKIVVNDKMQKGYSYYLTQPVGKNFDDLFKPELNPKQMLSLGVFGGKYMTDCQEEFPDSWFENAKLDSKKHDPDKNFFGVNASQPLSVWQEKGWINESHDPRGWFQWYCRYYLGRRLEEEDLSQIKRWRSYKRHRAQVKKNCPKKDYSCRTRQRQSLLHWAYDSRKY
jgi:hypothetical protein